jgi:ubiquitin carboxyl-terminal hydrolase 47
VNYFLSYLQIENAAEEPRVLCIIQDTTNSKTVNERLTVNLPASTSLSKLHEDVAHKAGYMIGTFDLAWGNISEMVSPFKPECS